MGLAMLRSHPCTRRLRSSPEDGSYWGVQRGRFAPSPTGALHLGSAATALFAAASAHRSGGKLVLRVEDLDPPRVVPGAESSQLDDLAWLGIRFDEGPDEGPCGPYRQSQRIELYAAAIDELAARGLTYLCDCSRAEIARVASAPHVGDEGPRYPGTCREFGMKTRDFKRSPAVRLRVPEGSVRWIDASGRFVEADVAHETGDYVLRRGDGVFAYQLAVVVDDLAMGITQVVRGADLYSSAARQAQLARLLGREPPSFAHVPLLVGDDGARLAKRSGGATVREHRERGADARELLGAIASAYGYAIDARGDAVGQLAEALDPGRSFDRAVQLSSVLTALRSRS
jgi:glutamyl-tRNA synthetase